ncbi:MAG: hypothetical protein LBD05_00080 [Mycoplasmataceae bacterium]|jgi:hypothetical protein|nr:hypothetical protein [Mycoplasmataceae bacterium]
MKTKREIAAEIGFWEGYKYDFCCLANRDPSRAEEAKQEIQRANGNLYKLRQEWENAPDDFKSTTCSVI